MGKSKRKLLLARPNGLQMAACVAALLPLSACGGGGVSSTPAPISTPTPAPPPAPAPAPSPTPTPPPVNYDTAEYRRSTGLAFHNAITAYNEGATGAGVTVGVIDTGVDRESDYFTGRISGASRDFGGNASFDDEDGHGTAVSSVILAARDGNGTHGMAFDATLLSLRADTAGSCAGDPDDPEAGCSFSGTNVAAAINHARLSGARVINISLGGGGVGTTLRNAVTAAATAGIVIVVSAGNDGASTDADDDPDNPDEFAQGLVNAGNGNVIIAGSVGTALSESEISSFSNRAGSYRDRYLTAIGYRVRAPDYKGDIFLWSGTSFAAPQIAGAAALLAQAFPNLSGQQIVAILLSSGRDAGAPGLDAIYGQGILDLACAFQPSGSTSVAGSRTPVNTGGSGGGTGTSSSPMGDAFAAGSTETIILDRYDRAFVLDIAKTLDAPGPDRKLAPALAIGQRHVSMASPMLAVSLSLTRDGVVESYQAQRLGAGDSRSARVLAGSVIASLSPQTRFALGIGRGSDGLSAALEGQARPAFLVGEKARGQAGFSLRPQNGMAIRHSVVRDFAITLRGEVGSARVDEARPADTLRLPHQDYRYSTVGAGIDRRFGSVALSLDAELMNEEETVLGAKFGPVYGNHGAKSLFVDAGARFDMGAGWSINGQWRQGWTWAEAGGNVLAGSQLKSSAWSLDAAKSSLLTPADSFAVRVAQPLRVSDGGLRLNLPVGYDYATLQTQYGVRSLNLAPQGREVDVEAVYSLPLAGGRLTANAYYRKDPGNFAALSDDIGGAIRFTLGF